MLQHSDISTENLPLAALSARYGEKIYSGQPKMAVRRVLFVGNIIENSEPLPGSETTLM